MEALPQLLGFWRARESCDCVLCGELSPGCGYGAMDVCECGMYGAGVDWRECNVVDK